MAEVKGRLTIAIDDDVRKAFKVWCLSHDVTMSQVLERVAADLSDTKSGGSDENRLANEWYHRNAAYWN